MERGEGERGGDFSRLSALFLNFERAEEEEEEEGEGEEGEGERGEGEKRRVGLKGEGKGVEELWLGEGERKGAGEEGRD